MDTTLRFGGDLRADLEIKAISLSGALPVGKGWTARASIGALLDGSVKPQGGAAHSFEPGGLISVGADRRVRENSGYAPSVDLSILLGVTWAKTKDPVTESLTSYSAADLRFGARAAWQIARGLYPYVAARVFGGPVNWELDGEEVTGSDVHHYNLAVGAAAQFGPVGLFLEWAGLGEQGLFAGLGTAW